jgi:LacI family transcriptional regulator
MESMARSAALKLIADMIDEDNSVEEPSMFVSTLVKRGSVGPPES